MEYRLDGRNIISTKEFENNLYCIHEVANKYTDDIIFVGLTNISGDKSYNFSQERIDLYDSILQKFTLDVGVEFIELNGLLNKKCFNEDNIHPNSEGHKRICDKVKNKMKTTLDEEGCPAM